MTPTVLRINTSSDQEEKKGVSFPLWHITSILLKIPEHDSRWREEDGNFFLDSWIEQTEMFKEHSEPLFFECPKRWDRHYVLTPRGEKIAKYFEKRDTTTDEVQTQTAEIINFSDRKN